MLLIEDGAEVRAKAFLDPAHYQAALTAHGASIPIVVEAELHRVRRGYELREIAALGLWRNLDGKDD
jgi:hypothetical protein